MPLLALSAQVMMSAVQLTGTLAGNQDETRENTMDWDEATHRPVKGITTGQALDTLSIGELEERVAILAIEIDRHRAEIVRKRAQADAAASIFKL